MFIDTMLCGQTENTGKANKNTQDNPKKKKKNNNNTKINKNEKENCR